MAEIPVTIPVIRQLQRLVAGETLPSCCLKGSWVKALLDDGLLTPVSRGSRLSYRAFNTEELRNALSNRQPEFKDLDLLLDVLSSEGEIARNLQVKVFGDSKHSESHPVSGFMLNALEPIEVMMRGMPLLVMPTAGYNLFISDHVSLEIPEDVVVVGVENMQNFLQAERQCSLFERYIPGRRLLFASRYPGPATMKRWVSRIPNDYVHFGDFDLYGVQIYLGFYNVIGERASMLVPDDIEKLLSSNMASKELYLKQAPTMRDLKVTDSRVQPLVSLIHRYQRGFEQEGLIIS